MTTHRHPGQAAGTTVTAHTTDNIGGTWPGGVWGNRQDRLGGRIPDYAHTGDEKLRKFHDKQISQFEIQDGGGLIMSADSKVTG